MGLRREHDREQFPPRLIRFRAAPAYLGMNKNLFNQLVRPCVSVIPLGKRAIVFDRLELDCWAEQYCQRYGRPALRKEGQLCRNGNTRTQEALPHHWCVRVAHRQTHQRIRTPLREHWNER